MADQTADLNDAITALQAADSSLQTLIVNASSTIETNLAEIVSAQAATAGNAPQLNISSQIAQIQSVSNDLKTMAQSITTLESDVQKDVPVASVGGTSTTGLDNTGLGSSSLTGSANTGLGASSVTGSDNLGLGNGAGTSITGSDNTATSAFGNTSLTGADNTSVSAFGNSSVTGSANSSTVSATNTSTDPLSGLPVGEPTPGSNA